MVYMPVVCTEAVWVTDRTMRMRSTSLAIRGNSSETRMPSTFVEIELSSPRISAGASGFMSQVSSCDGPPLRNTWMHRLALPNDGRGSPTLAEARDRPGEISPAGQSRLAWRNSRLGRDGPIGGHRRPGRDRPSTSRSRPPAGKESLHPR